MFNHNNLTAQFIRSFCIGIFLILQVATLHVHSQTIEAIKTIVTSDLLQKPEIALLNFNLTESSTSNFVLQSETDSITAIDPQPEAGTDGSTNSNQGITVHPVYTRNIGRKSYELKDHLGNVRVVVSDRKVMKSSNPAQQPAGIGSTGASGDYFIAQIDTVDSLSAVTWAESLLVAMHGTSYELINMDTAPGRGGGTTWVVNITLGTGAGSASDEVIAGDYIAEILSAQDYYPFGMIMSGRNFVSMGYRYGFNGKEKDDEVKGSGDSYDFGARVYDSRLGKFLSIDSYTSHFPHSTPFNFAANNPIKLIDENGDFAVEGGPGKGLFPNVKLTITQKAMLITMVNNNMFHKIPNTDMDYYFRNINPSKAKMLSANGNGKIHLNKLLDLGGRVPRTIINVKGQNVPSNGAGGLAFLSSYIAFKGLLNESGEEFRLLARTKQVMDYLKIGYSRYVVTQAASMDIIEGDLKFITDVANYVLSGRLPKGEDGSLTNTEEQIRIKDGGERIITYLNVSHKKNKSSMSGGRVLEDNTTKPWMSFEEYKKSNLSKYRTSELSQN